MLQNINHLTDTLKAARKARRVSQAELAEKVGIPQGHISRIESGNVNIKLASFVEIARTLELEPMLVPRQDAAMIESLIASMRAERGENSPVPAYTLSDDGD